MERKISTHFIHFWQDFFFFFASYFYVSFLSFDNIPFNLFFLKNEKKFLHPHNVETISCLRDRRGRYGPISFQTQARWFFRLSSKNKEPFVSLYRLTSGLDQTLPVATLGGKFWKKNSDKIVFHLINESSVSGRDFKHKVSEWHEESDHL